MPESNGDLPEIVSLNDADLNVGELESRLELMAVQPAHICGTMSCGTYDGSTCHQFGCGTYN